MRRWIGVSLLCIAVSAVLIAIGVRANLGMSEWAAWVQAVGSILAILGAVWATQAQISSQATLAIAAEERAAKRKNDALRAVLDGAAQQFLKLAPIMNADRDQDVSTLEMLFYFEDRAFSDAISCLETIELVDLGSYELVKAVAGMKIGMVSLRNAALQLMDPHRDHDESPSHRIEAFGADLIAQLSSNYSIAAELLGGTPIATSSKKED